MKTNVVISLSIGLVLLLAACGGAMTPGAGPASAETATLREVQGAVQIRNPIQAEFAAAANGDVLQAQGQVSTGQDGRARLDLSTGTIIRVAPDSLFTLESNQLVNDSLLTHLLLQSGKVWVILNGGTLEIQTPSGTASVRGSFMSVWMDPATDDAWVACLEGRCRVENLTGALDLVAGQGATLYSFDPQGDVPPPSPHLRHLAQAEIDEFLANNPEAEEVMPAVRATASALPTLVPSGTPTATSTATPTTSPAATFTQTVAKCSSLLSPANGASLGLSGSATLRWTEYPGAYKYVVNLKLPGGALASAIEFGTSHVLSLNSLPLGGVYEWWVTVKNSNLGDVCSSEHFSFVKPPALLPTVTPTPGGTVTFWNQTGPTGGIGSCLLSFAVETDAPANSMVKVVFSRNAVPNGNVDPHVVMTPSGGRKFSTAFNLHDAGAVEPGVVIYWRFAIYNGAYIHDGNIYSFVSPGCPPSQPTDTPTTFFNWNGPVTNSTVCTNHFQVSAVDPEGLQYVKVAYKVFDMNNMIVLDSYQHLDSMGENVWAGELYLAMQPNYTVVWWFWSIDGSGNSANSETQSFVYTGTDACP